LTQVIQIEGGPKITLGQIITVDEVDYEVMEILENNQFVIRQVTVQ
jgi:hypothetical protein